MTKRKSPIRLVTMGRLALVKTRRAAVAPERQQDARGLVLAMILAEVQEEVRKGASE